MKYLSKPEKLILKGIPMLFIMGTLMHFMYEFLGKNPIIGLISSVNESVWEHCKMVLIPLVLWWSVYYFAKGKQYGIPKNKWFSSALIALITTIFSIPLLFYFYTGAFGVEIIWVDISILFLSLTFGQLIGLHFFKHGKGINSNIVMIIFIIIIFIFIVFTFYPPQIPLFLDKTTGRYGIAD